MKIEQLKNTATPIIFIYGNEGRGKTTLANRFSKSVWMLIERGLPAGVIVDAISDLNTFAQVVEALRALYLDPGPYRTLVIDTLDSLEPLLLDHVCAQHNWKNIESPSYGKGYVVADTAWQGFLKGLDALRVKHGITIVLTAHAAVERFDDPRAPTYTMYLPKLHKRARALVCDAADVIGFVAEELRVTVDLQGEEIKSWHRTNVSRVAALLAIRVGRATSQGRPIMWSPRPELMQERRWVGPKHGRSSRPTE